jgi:anti-anti-sigma factor
MSRTIAESVGSLNRGDHACLAYVTQETRRDAVLRFVRDGLGGGEKVFYYADGDDSHATDWLRNSGDEVADALERDQLEVVRVDGAAMSPDQVEPDALVEGLSETIAAALEQGYPACRSTGEMTWALAAGMSTPSMLDYETRADAVLRETGTTGLCQFDCSRFDQEAVRETQDRHPLMLAEPGDHLLDECLLVEPGPKGELVLRGEVDHFSCDSLATSLAAAAARKQRVRLDLRALDFIDVAGLRAIVLAAEQLRARGGEVTLISPQSIVTHVMSLLGIDSAVRVEAAA